MYLECCFIERQQYTGAGKTNNEWDYIKIMETNERGVSQTEAEMISRDKESGKWQWDKNINLFGLLALIIAVASAVWNLSDEVADNRRSIELHNKVVAVELIAMQSVDANLDRTIIRQNHEIVERLKASDRTLDRIEDAVNRHLENTNGRKQD